MSALCGFSNNGRDQYTFKMVDCAETKIQRTRAPENAIRDGGWREQRTVKPYIGCSELDDKEIQIR